jgi:tRNA threonylcarbamoyladenosine biosynthesis protein TsaB
VTKRWVLGFDASTPRCVVVLGHVGPGEQQTLVVADEHDDPGGNQASVHLVPRLRSAMQRAGIEPAQLHAVACGCGPGTFTGVRVAVSTAKGLCVGLGCPLVPVSTLTAVALSAERSGWVLPLLDARRGETYGGLLRVTWGDDGAIFRALAIGEPRCAPPSALAEDAMREAGTETVTVVGPGVEPHLTALPERLRSTALILPGPSAAGLWGACTHALVSGAALDPADAEAVYLRKSYAELGVNTPKRPFSRSPFV